MARNKSKSLPKFESLDELVGFFDANDMGEYWDEMPAADFDISIKTKKHMVTIDEEIIPSLDEIAKSKKISSEKLINRWLREKIETSKRV
jgi:hypothetical protein